MSPPSSNIHQSKASPATANTSVALVMDGSVNGLGIVRSLAADSDIDIVLLCERKSRSFAAYSKYISHVYEFGDNDNLVDTLVKINQRYSTIIAYPCSDRNYWVLVNNKKQLTNFKGINNEEQLAFLSKQVQYEAAGSNGVPIPKTWFIGSEAELSDIANGLSFPLIIKPDYFEFGKDVNKKEIFKVRQIDSLEELRELVSWLQSYGLVSMVSEFVHGGEENLYTYGGVAFEGQVIASYIGHKVFHSVPSRVVAAAVSDSSKELDQSGATIVGCTGHTGLFQVEFKRCEKTGVFKFIEINLRNWLWGELSTKSGNNLPLINYNQIGHESGLQKREESTNHSDASIGGQTDKKQVYIWEGGMVSNAFHYKTLGPLKFWLKSVFDSKTDVLYAVFSLKDLKPFNKFIAVGLSKVFLKKKAPS